MRSKGCTPWNAPLHSEIGYEVFLSHKSLHHNLGKDRIILWLWNDEATENKKTQQHHCLISRLNAHGVVDHFWNFLFPKGSIIEVPKWENSDQVFAVASLGDQWNRTIDCCLFVKKAGHGHTKNEKFAPRWLLSSLCLPWPKPSHSEVFHLKSLSRCQCHHDVTKRNAQDQVNKINTKCNLASTFRLFLP